MELSKENRERLKKVAILAVPAALGAVAVKNERIQNAIKHTSYWEKSKSFILDYIPDGVIGSIRLSGTVEHGPNGKKDIVDVDLHEGFDYSPESIKILETVFLPNPENTD